MAASQPESGSFLERLEATLASLWSLPRGHCFVAFSGGVDSTLLLQALSRTFEAAQLTAIHIDHGLHADSGRWSEHCASIAERLKVNFILRRVHVDCDSGHGIESAARTARYDALAAELTPGDVLLTAHHADDQLETLLLRLLRGAGVRGLAGIHARASLGSGLMLRPLLGFRRQEILDEATRLGLDWLEDPSNADDRFDRNFLRNRCLPDLLARWPGAGPLASRMAAHMSEAQQLLDDLAADDLAASPDPACLPITLLRELSRPRRSNALRFAIHRLGLALPTVAQLVELERELEARPDASACVRWADVEARIYRDRLYLLEHTATAQEVPDATVTPDRPARLGSSELRLVRTTGYGIPDQWARAGLRIDYRRGGERLQAHGDRHHRSLKRWFQDEGIVPWMRQLVPLLYREDRLVAVADLCLVADLPTTPGEEPVWKPCWNGHQRLR